MTVDPSIGAVAIDGMLENDASQATTIDWGDGSTETLDAGQTEADHSYDYGVGDAPVSFTITFSGGCETTEGILFEGG